MDSFRDMERRANDYNNSLVNNYKQDENGDDAVAIVPFGVDYLFNLFESVT